MVSEEFEAKHDDGGAAAGAIVHDEVGRQASGDSSVHPL